MYCTNNYKLTTTTDDDEEDNPEKELNLLDVPKKKRKSSHLLAGTRAKKRPRSSRFLKVHPDLPQMEGESLFIYTLDQKIISRNVRNNCQV